jgi:hypothetical protein
VVKVVEGDEEVEVEEVEEEVVEEVEVEEEEAVEVDGVVEVSVGSSVWITFSLSGVVMSVI